MIELGGAQPSANAGDLIKDVTEQTFMADVVDASNEVPVIVDFWATWCGPCKTLGPMLEKAVTEAKGAVKMVKIDVDQNQRLTQALAQQGLPLQSIPTVVAFVQGRPVDMFQGAVPASEIDAFIKRAIEAAGGDASGGLDDAVAAAEEMLEQGEAADAVETFAAILQEDPAHAKAYAGLVKSYLALGQTDQAEATLNGAPVEISKTPELEAAHAQIQLARQAENAGPVAELQAKVEASPDDLQLRFDLARAMQAAGDTAGAVDQLLDIFGRDRDWNDGAAKTQLLTIFDALDAKDPVALTGRRKLSSMIFA